MGKRTRTAPRRTAIAGKGTRAAGSAKLRPAPDPKPPSAPLAEDSWQAALYAALSQEREQSAALYKALGEVTAMLTAHQERVAELTTRLTKVETDLPSLAHRLLPAVNSLNRLATAREDDQLESYQQAVQRAARALDRGLAASGIEFFGEVGEIIDLDLDTHDVDHARETGDVPKDTVLEVIERGVRVQGKVQQPARVIIAAPEKPGPDLGPELVPALSEQTTAETREEQ